MPPKVDPSEVRFINIKVFGGEGGPASTLAPKLGPLGLVFLTHYHRIPNKSETRSSPKAPNGKESELWSI